VLVAVLEGGIWAAVAGAAAVSISATIAIGSTVVFDIGVSFVALFAWAVKQLHEVVPERFNTWLLAAHRYFGQGFDDQALVVADAAKRRAVSFTPSVRDSSFVSISRKALKSKLFRAILSRMSLEISRSAVYLAV
jgi:hypothetical protein